jgi:hypothetical protein
MNGLKGVGADPPSGVLCNQQPIEPPVSKTPEELREGLNGAFENLARDPNKRRNGMGPQNPCGEIELDPTSTGASTAMRFNSGKPFMHYILFFPRVAELLARIFEGGEHKYDYGNWRLGKRPDKEYMDCLMRHLFKLDGKGEMFDEDFCTHHIGHAIWNLMVRFELGDDPIVSSMEDFQQAMLNMDEIKRRREAA